MRATVTALVDGGFAPGASPTPGFQAARVPSNVEKMKAACFLGARRKSVGLVLEITPVGLPVGKLGLLGFDLGIVTTRGCLSPGPL